MMFLTVRLNKEYQDYFFLNTEYQEVNSLFRRNAAIASVTFIQNLSEIFYKLYFKILRYNNSNFVNLIKTFHDFIHYPVFLMEGE